MLAGITFFLMFSAVVLYLSVVVWIAYKILEEYSFFPYIVFFMLTFVGVPLSVVVGYNS